MSNALTIQATDISAVRVAKSGTKTTRNLLGILSSGNRKERDYVVHSLISKLWLSGNFGPLAAECSRVYGKLLTEGAKFLRIDLETGLVQGIVKDGVQQAPAISNRAAWERLFEGLNERNEAKDTKGQPAPFKAEKKLYLEAINAALLASALQAKIQAEEKQAALAALDKALEADGIVFEAPNGEPLPVIDASALPAATVALPSYLAVPVEGEAFPELESA